MRAWSSSTTSSSGNAARASSRRSSAGVSTSLCPGAPRRARSGASSAELAPSRSARAARGRGAAGRTRRRRARRSRELELLVAHLDDRALARAGRLQRALELLLATAASRARGSRPRCAAAATSAPSARACRRGSRPARPRRVLGDRLGDEREQPPAEVVDPSPVAHESAEHGDHARVVDRERRIGLEVDLVQHDDLRQLVEPGAVRAELGVDRAPLLVGAAATRRSRGRACAPARGARGTRARARRPRSRPRSSPGTSATTSCRPSGDSTVPSTGCSVVNGYSATFGRAFEMRVSSDDLPAFGRPTSAASASSLRCSSMSSSSPGRADLREARHLPRRARRSARCRARRGRPSRARRARRMREVGDQVAVVGEHLRADRDAELDVVAVRAVLARAASVLALAPP